MGFTLLKGTKYQERRPAMGVDMILVDEKDDFVAEGLKTVMNRAQVVKALLLLHPESDDSSQYPRLTSQLSLLSTLNHAGELTDSSVTLQKKNNWYRFCNTIRGLQILEIEK
ncbi:unnamed protein product [Brassica oleracea]